MTTPHHRRGASRWLQGPMAAWLHRTGLCVLGSIGLAACVYDADDRCGEHQAFDEAERMCLCESGFVLADGECVSCGAHEVSGPTGCVCDEGYLRADASAPCEPIPAGQGLACDAETESCPDPAFPYCHAPDAGEGYCTTSECSSSDDCSGGYACDLTVSPSVCRRPPAGLGQSCESADDCAGGEATYCDAYMTHSCLVENCTLSPDNCFDGYECCDLSGFGVPTPICVAEGSCAS